MKMLPPGKYYPEKLSNDDLLAILEYQNIGTITRAGAKFPELMNLSGLNLTKLNFTYLKTFVGSNIKGTNFSYTENPDASFRGSTATKANFSHADLEKANFIRALIDNVI